MNKNDQNVQIKKTAKKRFGKNCSYAYIIVNKKKVFVLIFCQIPSFQNSKGTHARNFPTNLFSQKKEFLDQFLEGIPEVIFIKSF